MTRLKAHQETAHRNLLSDFGLDDFGAEADLDDILEDDAAVGIKHNTGNLGENNPPPKPTPKKRASSESKTEVCGIYSPSLHDPPIRPRGRSNNKDKTQVCCPRCDYAYSRPDSIRKHFVKCITLNGNPHSLRWRDWDKPDILAAAAAKGSAVTVRSTVAGPSNNICINEQNGVMAAASPAPIQQRRKRADAGMKRKRKQYEDEDRLLRDEDLCVLGDQVPLGVELRFVRGQIMSMGTVQSWMEQHGIEVGGGKRKRRNQFGEEFMRLTKPA